MVEALPILLIGAVLVAFGAVALPLLLHDSDTGVSFFDQLFDVNVTNATNNDIVIFENGTWVNTNGTAFVENLIGNITGQNFTQTDETHVSLGGDAAIFKNETDFTANFRGISGGIGVNVTERNTDALIALNECNDEEFLLFNATTKDYECVTGQTFAANTSIDNDEIFFPHLSATNADDVKITFTNYDMRAVRFNDNVNVAATWKYVVPVNFNSTGTTMQFKLFWFSQSSDVGNVCWQFRINDIVENDDLDFSLTQVQEICTANLGIDILAVDTFLIPASTHNFEAGDLAWIQIHREAKQDDNPNDTFEQNAFAVIGELRWIA